MIDLAMIDLVEGTHMWRSSQLGIANTRVPTRGRI
jgi:hypothetical protein